MQKTNKELFLFVKDFESGSQAYIPGAAYNQECSKSLESQAKTCLSKGFFNQAFPIGHQEHS